jgi:hypothetical protein
MTVEQKVWKKQLAARGYNPISWFVYEENCGSPTQGAEWQPCVFEEVNQPLVPPPFILDSGGTPPATVSFVYLDGI